MLNFYYQTLLTCLQFNSIFLKILKFLKNSAYLKNIFQNKYKMFGLYHNKFHLLFKKNFCVNYNFHF